MKASILDREAPFAVGAAGPAAPPRPHLRLVPTGDDVVRGPRDERSAPAPMRLTTLGRLVVSLAAAVVLALLLSAFAGSFAAASGEAKQITVRAGQTLSGIAVEHLPQLPVREAVVELQLLNGLSTSQIHAGQKLLIPSP